MSRLDSATRVDHKPNKSGVGTIAKSMTSRK
jgi:hypothetical protein